MAIKDLDFSDILDVSALKRDCDVIFREDGRRIADIRSDLLREASTEGREKARERLKADGSGIDCARRISWLQDRLIETLYDLSCQYVYPKDAPQIAVAAVGGYGRGTLAPGSDIDLLFLLPTKNTPDMHKAVEFVLYLLWDLGFKVGHATRTVDECIRLSKSDMTIRTAILEVRAICGKKSLTDDLEKRFESEVVTGTGPEFIAAKLAERDQRHRKAGDTRYLVEPNVKEGKGGLRDLHTLFWIAKYYYHVRDTADLVKLGVLSRSEHRQGGRTPFLRYSARNCRCAELSAAPRPLRRRALHEALFPRRKRCR